MQTPAFLSVLLTPPCCKPPVTPSPPFDSSPQAHCTPPNSLQPSCNMPNVPPCGRPGKCPRLSGNPARGCPLVPQKQSREREQPPPGHRDLQRTQIAEPGPQGAVGTHSRSGHPTPPGNPCIRDGSFVPGLFPQTPNAGRATPFSRTPGLKRTLPSL